MFTFDPDSISLQLVNIPQANIPNAYPIDITIAAKVRPLGKVFSAFSVWSTNPPKTSNPPNANIANVKNDNTVTGV